MINRIVVVLIVAFLFFGASCREEEMTSGDALLIGIDYRKCATPFCGGWFIEIDGDTLRFFERPKETDIDLNAETEFPIPVKIKWMRYQNEWMEIDDLIKVNTLFRD